MSDKPPESPTTVQPLDFSDDEDAQETGITNMDDTNKSNPTTGAAAAEAPKSAAPTTATSANPQTTTTTTTSDDTPPPKPPRPETEQQKNEAILKEAFPSIDAGVIKAVLIASGGRIDPAFNALLGMSDPDAVQHDAEDEVPPPQPPRPQLSAQAQLEADEAYARRLAEHYESSAYEARTSNSRGAGGPRSGARRQQTGLKPNELYDDRDHSFIDDDLPIIQEQLKKGFQETQTKVNTWFQGIKKKFDEQFDEPGGPSSQQPGGQYGRRASGDTGRRSRDYERYDADPELLSDDFAGMKFHSDGTPARPGQPNPNAFRPPPSSTSPKPNDGRKVAFKDGAEEIDNIYNSSPKNTPKDAAAPAKASKWQPLSDVDPSPIAENDPFSLGDSDDDKDVSHKPDRGIKMEEVEDDEEERLRKAAAEAMQDSLVDDKARKDEVKK